MSNKIMSDTDAEDDRPYSDVSLFALVLRVTNAQVISVEYVAESCFVRMCVARIVSLVCN